MLVLLGGVIVAQGLRRRRGRADRRHPLASRRPDLGAVIFFGLTVRGLGLVAALFVHALMSAFASRRTRLRAALLIAVGLTILCVLVFVVALRLRLPLVGPWIPV